MKRPMSGTTDQQNEFHGTTDIFYIDSIKFVTLTKASSGTGALDSNDMTSVKDFFSLLLENGQRSCIVQLNKSYLAFWISDDKYVLFQPMNMFHKSPKCVQLSSFDCVQLYIEKSFLEAEMQVKYVFYTFDVLKINDGFVNRDEILKILERGGDGRISVNSEAFVNESVVPHKMCLLPSTPGLSETSYEELTEETSILRCPKSIDRVSFLLITFHSVGN